MTLRKYKKNRAIPEKRHDCTKRNLRRETAYFNNLPPGNIKEEVNVTNQTEVYLETLAVLNAVEIENPMAVTLTMKQTPYVYRDEHTAFEGYDVLDKIKASKNLKHFMNMLNAELFKGNNISPFKTSRKYLRLIPVFEGMPMGEPKLHYHTIMERPEHIPECLLKKWIRYYWPTTFFGNEEIDVKPIHWKEGWLEYIFKTKRCKKLIYGDVDWHNFRD